MTQLDLFEKKKQPTVTKHQLLESYLRPWARIIGSHFSSAWYVDAFAGRPKYKSGEKGSSRIAADILVSERQRLLEKRQRRCDFNIICVEKDADRAANLREYADGLSARIPFRVFQGEFVRELPQVLQSIQHAAAFFFLDPTGFSGMPMTAVRDILALGHKEVLVNFMWYAMQRWSRAPSSQHAVTELMGTQEWRGLKDEREWLDLYMRQLKARGRYVWAFRNKFPGKRRTLYYLVYATNNLTGFKIMKEVMLRENTTRYFEPDLFEQMEFLAYVKELESRVRRAGALSRQELLDFTLCHTQYLDKHLRNALKQLEGSGRIVKQGPPRALFYRAVGPSPNRENPGLVEEGGPAPYGSTSSALAAPPLRRVKIKYANYECLDGNVRRLVRQVGDGSIIKRFDRTPIPKKERDVVCPHFLELKWAYGCPYDCAWCYLKGTFRFSPTGPRPTIKDFEKVRRHTVAFLDSDSEGELLNTGEIADSLMHESTRHSFARFVLPLFEAQTKHKVLFLTKSDHIDNLLAADSHRQAIVSFSLNAHEVAEKWEAKAPDVSKRISAAKRLSDEGYEVRIRVDPLVPLPGWRDAYLRLLDEMFASLIPARITLGSLRGLQSTINNCPDKSWVVYLSDTSRWGRRIDLNLRCEMFGTLLEALRQQYDYVDVGLCKETLSVWTALSMDFRRIQCNCIL